MRIWRKDFDPCKPRDDLLKTEIGRTDPEAAALAQVIRNFGSDEYRNLALFFPNTITYAFIHGSGNEDDRPLDCTVAFATT